MCSNNAEWFSLPIFGGQSNHERQNIFFALFHFVSYMNSVFECNAHGEEVASVLSFFREEVGCLFSEAMKRYLLWQIFSGSNYK